MRATNQEASETNTVRIIIPRTPYYPSGELPSWIVSCVCVRVCVCRFFFGRRAVEVEYFNTGHTTTLNNRYKTVGRKGDAFFCLFVGFTTTIRVAAF